MMTLDDIMRNVSIIELAQHYGYEIQKSGGTRVPILKNEANGDKICVFNPNDTYRQRYFSVHNDADKGSLYSFVKNRLEMGIIPNNTSYSVSSEIGKCVMSTLHDYLKIPYETREKRLNEIAEFQKHRAEPVQDFRPLIYPLRNTQFLTSRGFSDKVLNDPLFEGRIGNFMDKYDIALPIYDSEDKMIGLEHRNKGVKLFVAGSERSAGVWRSNLPKRIKRVLITESPLDAIAHHQMMPDDNTLYFAHGGTLCKAQIDTINTIIRNNINKVDIKNFEYMLGADNDCAGTSYDISFIKSQLSKKGLIIEANSSNLTNKGFTIHKGSYNGFEGFRNKFLDSIKNDNILCRSITNGDDCYLSISYPQNDMTPERDLCTAILNSGILPHTKLEKAVMNDWNDDLMRIKEINRDIRRFITHEEFAQHKEWHQDKYISTNPSKKLTL